MPEQMDFFAAEAGRPEGFRYQPEVLDRDLEAELLRRMPDLPFAEFEFHGYRGRRRTVSYGWRYDSGREAVEEAAEIPPFLLALRDVAGRFAGLPPAELGQVLVSEYPPGAAIGWHRDKAVFGDVVGISLQSPCVFRLRRRLGARWERSNVLVEPRSAYLLRGPARTEWEHSIRPVAALRYAITFRQKAARAAP